MADISEEVIWITGASSGIGRAIALELATMGNRVIASARGQQALNELAAMHSNIIPLVFDVSREDLIDQVREQLQQHSLYLDRVILNAGNCEYLDLDQPDWQMMRRIMSVNYFGAVNTLAVAMPLLQISPSANAHIVGIASLATVAPFPKAEAYGASKAALQYFLDALQLDLQPQNIDVTVINPGFVQTPLTDKNTFAMPFMISADEAATRIVKAIARRPRQYDFPSRLKWMLKVLAAVPLVWNKIIVPSPRV